MGAMKRNFSKNTKAASAPLGPTQRQLRAGELVRHALVEILREEEIHDEDLRGVSITVTEVRCSPDLKHAAVFVEPLGVAIIAGEGHAAAVKIVIDALNRHSKYVPSSAVRKSHAILITATIPNPDPWRVRKKAIPSTDG